MKIRLVQLTAKLICMALITSCSNGEQSLIKKNNVQRSIQLSSSAFSDGGTIPKEYACDGKDISPALKWTNTPKGTKSFVLIADDPDAPSGTWTHWILFNIAANASELPEGIQASEQIMQNAKQGINDFKKIGYGGPCPPLGNEHHYYFKIYALDVELNLNAGASKDQVIKEMNNHVLGEGQLIGTYKK